MGSILVVTEHENFITNAELMRLRGNKNPNEGSMGMPSNYGLRGNGLLRKSSLRHRIKFFEGYH